MAHTNDINELEKRLETITKEIDLLEKQITTISPDQCGDDSDDDSHLQYLASKLDKLVQKQNECVLLLRNAGRPTSVNLYDGY